MVLPICSWWSQRPFSLSRCCLSWSIVSLCFKFAKQNWSFSALLVNEAKNKPVSNSHKYTDKIYAFHILYLWDTIYAIHVLDSKNVILLAWQGEVVREEWPLKLADHVQKSPQNALFLHGMRNVCPQKMLTVPQLENCNQQ